MTVLVAVKCSDGAVVGSDSIATSSAGPQPLMQIQSADKVKLVGDRVLVAGTGDAGLGQRFGKHVQNAWDGKHFQKTWMDCCVHISAEACKDFQNSGTPRTLQNGFGFGAILVAPFGQSVEVVEFGIIKFQPEQKIEPIHFVSMGAGQILADPFLGFVNRVLWKGKSPTIERGLLGVYWTLMHTIEFAPGGVGHPMQFGILKREGGQWHASVKTEEDFQQIGQHVTSIEETIRNTRLIDEADSSKPPEPPPE